MESVAGVKEGGRAASGREGGRGPTPIFWALVELRVRPGGSCHGSELLSECLRLLVHPAGPPYLLGTWSGTSGRCGRTCSGR